MRFLDIAKVYASSGKGGNGCAEHRPAALAASGRATKE